MNPKNLISIEQICESYEIEFSFINSLNDYGLVDIIKIEQKNFISIEKINEVEKIIRLHDDLGVNLEGIDIITNLVKKIEDLQNKLHLMKNQLRIYED